MNSVVDNKTTTAILDFDLKNRALETANSRKAHEFANVIFIYNLCLTEIPIDSTTDPKHYVNLLVSFAKEQAHGGALNDLISEHVTSSCAAQFQLHDVHSRLASTGGTTRLVL